MERQHILEVAERLDFEGTVLVAFDEDAARGRRAARGRARPASRSRSRFLHSYVNPRHEERMAAILREVAPDIEVTVCSDALAASSASTSGRARASSTPTSSRSSAATCRKLEATLAERGFAGQFLTTRSGGGAMTASTAKDAPVNLILSGPAGGVLGAAWFARGGAASPT